MSNQSPQSSADLRQHLADQIGFLESSADAFDADFHGEAKRLATTIRVLLHDTRHSKSLLGQLGMKDVLFFDSAHPRHPRAVTTYCGLTVLMMGPQTHKYVPMLDDTLDGPKRPLPFEAWWDSTVIVDNTHRRFTRKNLVLAVANQDGGAHVDPTLDEHYARLSRRNSLAWYHVPNRGPTVPVDGAVPATIRQIAHELLKTFRPGYTKKPQDEPGTVLIGDVTLAEVGPKLGRNEPCSCGSGKKFKRCCGRAV